MPTALVLGDQLDADAVEEYDRLLMVESAAFARRRRYHAAKLTLVFAAMRAFRDRLRERGTTVRYERADTFAAGFAAFFGDNPDAALEAMRPASHDAAAGIRAAVESAGGEISFRENELFLCSPAAFDAWHDGEGYEHESFYRRMRRETGYLMDGDDPEGGEWNYDDRNRETPPAGYEPPELPAFDYGEEVRETHEWVCKTFDTWGNDGFGAFEWPVTRAQAERALESFLDDRLADFGPYEDAMVAGEPVLEHSLLSAALNLGLLRPDEVVERAIETYREREDVPINSVEGFLRQVIGWREFMRHVYREEMPGLADANQLGAERDLPPAYWEPERTEMNCLGECAGGVYERGYAHHIQRLMVLSNLALTYGADPAELNEWFHAGFVDAYHWATTPNVIGMGVFGTDAFTSKPYATSANYVEKMSDYCSGCVYDPEESVGESACPFNTLYWDFLAEHEERLRSNHRMGLVYSHVDDKRESGELEEIRAYAETVREELAAGER
jgi:deoxyribodipyrimidine photolyase-related protein